VKYYRLKASHEGSKTVTADLAAGGVVELEKVRWLKVSLFYVIVTKFILCVSLYYVRTYFMKMNYNPYIYNSEIFKSGLRLGNI
jgi:hypothetical protein